MGKIGLIIQREYLERVKKKSFLITTFVIPLVIIIIIGGMLGLMIYNTPDKTIIGVKDLSTQVYKNLRNNDFCEFVNIEGDPEQQVEQDDLNGYIIIPSNFLDEKSPSIIIYIKDGISEELQTNLSNQLESILKNKKLIDYNIENLSDILDDINNTKVTVNKIRIAQDAGGIPWSLSLALGGFMSFLLYLFIMMYGNMVMTSIIEEKNNRVLELVVSSVKPTQLMLGKIIGVGLVAVTQMVIWSLVIMFVFIIAIPALIPSEITEMMSQAQNGDLMYLSQSELQSLNLLNELTNIGFIIEIFFWFIMFLIGGFLLYAALYAALGSAFDNIQDASQSQSFIIIPIFFALFVSTIIKDVPDSTLVLVSSLIPFTSPLIMLYRIPLGIPIWQPLVAIILLFASALFTIWFAGKIYRVGIFMYGKKPNIKEIIKWARYK